MDFLQGWGRGQKTEVQVILVANVRSVAPQKSVHFTAKQNERKKNIMAGFDLIDTSEELIGGKEACNFRKYKKIEIVDLYEKLNCLPP